MIKRFQKFITERFSLQNDFGITYTELGEIMYYITDEFPNLDWSVENSLQSALIEEDDNCFIIELYDKTIDFPNEMPVLHYIEPKVFDLISDVNEQLKPYELKVYTSDFGSTDAYYELVITKINHTPKDKQRGW
jgi:hypothetical protein